MKPHELYRYIFSFHKSAHVMIVMTRLVADRDLFMINFYKG